MGGSIRDGPAAVRRDRELRLDLAFSGVGASIILGQSAVRRYALVTEALPAGVIGERLSELGLSRLVS